MRKNKTVKEKNVNLKELHGVLSETMDSPVASEILSTTKKTEKTKQLGTELSKLLEKN